MTTTCTVYTMLILHTVYIFQIQRREVESHLQAAMRLHLDLACVKLGDTQQKLEETTRKLQKLENSFNGIEKDIHCSEEIDTFTWRIDGFSEVLRKVKSGEKTCIDSSPFYRCGYKCKLSLDPNGDGALKNTHLSVYLTIMKGKYDAILTWPFQKKVTFTVIDQQEKAKDRKNIVNSFIAESKRENFKRPVKEGNIGWGLAKFVSHEELQKRRYIVDGTIFIQLRITSSVVTVFLNS